MYFSYCPLGSELELEESETPVGALHAVTADLNADQAALRLVFQVLVADFTVLLKPAQETLTPTCTLAAVVLEYAPKSSLARVVYAAETAWECAAKAVLIAASRILTALATHAILAATSADLAAAFAEAETGAVVPVVVSADTGATTNDNAKSKPENTKVFLNMKLFIKLN